MGIIFHPKHLFKEGASLLRSRFLDLTTVLFLDNLPLEKRSDLWKWSNKLLNHFPMLKSSHIQNQREITYSFSQEGGEGEGAQNWRILVTSQSIFTRNHLWIPYCPRTASAPCRTVSLGQKWWSGECFDLGQADRTTELLTASHWLVWGTRWLLPGIQWHYASIWDYFGDKKRSLLVTAKAHWNYLGMRHCLGKEELFRLEMAAGMTGTFEKVKFKEWKTWLYVFLVTPPICIYCSLRLFLL